MSINQQYFVIERELNNHFPLLKWEQNKGIFCKGRAVPVNKFLLFSFADPCPKKPVLADYHPSPEPVISDRIRNMLIPLYLPQIQFIKAHIIDNDKVTHENYYFLHIFNEIECIDNKKSKIKKIDDLFSIVESIFLDEKLLNKIPENERLIFRLFENTEIILVHYSVKDIISSINPSGIRFIECNQWSISSFFH